MTAKEHYDNHLGSFYSWMAGDFNEKSGEFRQFLIDNAIMPASGGTAVDLGAGHGLQSAALAQIGFNVVAIDFSQHLLDELKANTANLSVTTYHDDILNFARYVRQPELIVCCGDTLPHLDSKSEIKNLIAEMAAALAHNGKLILSFRDYSAALAGNDRFIPVKSDDRKILTCILDYQDDFVTVTDLLHEKIENGWTQKVSTYQKVRIAADEILDYIRSAGLEVIFNQPVDRLVTIIAAKG